MKILNLSVEYKRPEPKTEAERKQFLPDAELSVDYINYACNKKYAEGLEGQLRRQFGRIQRKLDSAIDTKVNTVELEESEYDFIKKLFADDVKFPVYSIKYVNMLEDTIEEMSKVKKEDTKA